jgi:hypothetical protein
MAKVFIQTSLRFNQRGEPEIRINEENKKNLPIIKCKCGSELLLVPDVELMNNAIEKHVAEHIDKTELIATEDANQIREHLIIQVFEKANKQAYSHI